MQTTASPGRRAFLKASALSAVAITPALSSARATETSHSGNEEFSYEIVRSEAEWRALLSDDEFSVLRQKTTEIPHTSPLAEEIADGTYCCRGCDLTAYDSVWKAPLDIGWVFFHHSRANSVLTEIDGEPPDGMGDDGGPGAMVEVHCRRCASHLGHIVPIEGRLYHCINGIALRFIPAAA